MSDKLRVAFFVYPSAFQNIGGGEILLLKTKEYLEKEGVYCKLFDIWNDKLDNFDILHVFGAIKDCMGLMQTARNKGVKVVLVPIFFSTLQRTLYEHGGLKRKAAACLRHIAKAAFPFLPSGRRSTMLAADAIIPNSYAELKQIERLFGIDRKKMHVIPNCVDSDFEYGDERPFISKYNVKDFVLSVGRIEPRKNQLNLIRALKDFKAPLVMIGDPVSHYPDYYRQCRSEAGSNVVLVGRIGHEDPLLRSAYKACRCFVSQGWFETPGLAALEAALAGANVATTNMGCTKEYFRDLAEYFSPSSLKSIRSAAEKAFNKNKNRLLQKYVRENLLWDVAAKKNVEVYKKVLGKG